MAVGKVDVPVLELRRGWQHDVGIVCRVRLEMFERYGEQVFTRHAS